MDDLNKQYKAIVRNVKLKSWQKIAKLEKENRLLESQIEKKEESIEKIKEEYTNKLNSLETDFYKEKEIEKEMINIELQKKEESERKAKFQKEEKERQIKFQKEEKERQ